MFCSQKHGIGNAKKKKKNQLLMVTKFSNKYPHNNNPARKKNQNRGLN